MSRRHDIIVWGITVLSIAALLLSGYGGWLSPSRFGAMVALVVLAYPAIVCASVLLSVIWVIGRQWKCALAVALAIASTWPSLSATFPVSLPESDVDRSRTFKVMSYNVEAFSQRLWADTTQMHPALRVILDEDADFVILVQPVTCGLGYDELKSVNPWLSELDRQYPYRTHSRYDNVDLLSKHPFRAVPLHPPGISNRYFPYVIKCVNRYAFDIHLPDNRQLRLVGAYMTSFTLYDAHRRSELDSVGSNAHSLANIYRKFDKAFSNRERTSASLRDSLDTSPANVILCTDLNDVPQSYAYRTIVGDDLRDAFRECHTGYLSTFNDHHLPFHIDHILYRGQMRAVAFKRISSSASDHNPIVATFEWQ